MSVDKLGEEMPSWSPYSYSYNNPVVFVDPDGNKPLFWPGVTFTFIEFDAGVGWGKGYQFIRQSGVARDEVGKTHFIAQSRGKVDPLKSRRSEILAGASASVTGNVRQSWKKETFLGLLGEEGWSASGDLGLGVSVNAGFGDSEFTIGGGIGAGARINVNSTEIEQSISLTWDEADKVSSNDTKTNTWGLTNFEDVENGMMRANVTVGSGKDMKMTDQVVYSAKTDQKVWMSKEYFKQAKAIDE